MKVLKFGAVWCPGCLIMKPRWAKIEKEFPWLKTQYYDYDENKDMVEKYQVTDNIPEFIFLDQNGQEFLRLNGEVDQKKLIRIIKKNKNR
ncbi:MAG: hypothetical protein GF332_01845 [Candidatus Moranbacteria bacterium]|nr:hypothetical protein [Candidatus Moranbacteria bacterium]